MSFVLAAWEILKNVWKLFPPQVWAGIALVAGLVFYHLYAVHEAHRTGYAEGQQAEQAVCAAAEQKRLKAQAAADKKAQDALDAAQVALVTQQLDHEQELAAAARAAADALADAKARMPTYVSTLRIPSSDTPRGYLLWRSATAAWANGADLATAAKPAEGALDGPSGVPLTTLADTDLAQAAAFKDAVLWGAGWRTYAFDVKQSCEKTLAILTNQGATP